MESSGIIKLFFSTFLVTGAICGSLSRDHIGSLEPNFDSLLSNHDLTSETIRVNVNDPQQITQNPSLLSGMDAEVVQKLLKTKVPITKISFNKDKTQKITKTYTLGEDGSITMKSVTENVPMLTHTTANINSVGLWPIINSNTWKGREASSSNEPHWTPVSNQFYSSDKRIIGNNDFNSEFPVRANPNMEEKEIQLPRSWNPSTWSTPGFKENQKTEMHINVAGTPRIEPTVLPNLDDLVKELYEQKTLRNETISNPDTSSIQKPLSVIDIKDIPITAVFDNDKKLEGNLWRYFSPNLGTTSASQSKSDSEQGGITSSIPFTQTGTRTFTRTFTSDTIPKSSDFDRDIQGILNRAGIDANDVKNGTNIITRTRTEPDGRIITTTYSVKNIPVTIGKVSPPLSLNPLPNWATEKRHEMTNVPNYSYNKPTQSPIVPNLRPVATNYMPESAISEYLAKVGLTMDFIKGKNGEFTKTIIDDDGQVLTATFSLSSMVDNTSNFNKDHTKPIQEEPIK